MQRIPCVAPVRVRKPRSVASVYMSYADVQSSQRCCPFDFSPACVCGPPASISAVCCWHGCLVVKSPEAELAAVQKRIDSVTAEIKKTEDDLRYGASRLDLPSALTPQSIATSTLTIVLRSELHDNRKSYFRGKAGRLYGEKKPLYKEHMQLREEQLLMCRGKPSLLH